MTTCLFCQFAQGQRACRLAFDGPDVLAFHDIAPKAPTHILIIPKRHIATLNDLADTDGDIMGRLMLTARDLAQREGFAQAGYRTVINCNGDGGQSVFHIHMHLLAGRALSWPPG